MVQRFCMPIFFRATEPCPQKLAKSVDHLTSALVCWGVSQCSGEW